MPANDAHPQGYSPAQIYLHWIIAALVLWQLLFGDSMEDRIEKLDGIEGLLASSHVVVGFAILGLVLVRIALRLRIGAPAADANRVAEVAHLAFYGLLVATPVTGIAAYYFDLPTDDLHELAKPAFIALIAVHAAAALFHHFVRRDGVLRRMLVPGRPAPHPGGA